MARDQDTEKLHQRIRRLESTRTELEETRQRLAAERKFSESIVASLPGLFFMVDEEGLYHRWNKNLESLLGYSAEEIMLRDCRDFVPPEDRERIIEAVGVALREGHFTLKYNNQTKDGRPIPFFAQGVGVEIDGRRYVIGVELDLTELKEAERALRESEEHLRSLMETATNFAVYRLAFEEGDPNRARVVFVSPSIMDLLGVREPKDLDTWFESIHPEDAERIMASHFSLPRPERSDQTMRVFHSRLGEWRWIQFLSTSIIDSEGLLRFSNGIIFDVTDRIRAAQSLKRKEEELKRQADKLARLNTALQVLVEHREQEIKETESSVLNTLQRLVRPYLRDLDKTRLDDEQRTYLEIIGSNLEKITSPLTRKLATWQRLLSPAELRVADLIRNGIRTKEIAQLAGVSDNAVAFHRKNIRRKLGLANRKINLAAYLQSLDNE